ncbi:hypothetical protein LP419_30325 [Massilia sp. H-1]|nr:hypothetical protein LP419_30325 [Massilia sp. H-1]
MIKQGCGALALAIGALCAQAGNPIVRDIYTADPAALVDEGRVYLYVGHDEAPAGRQGLCDERVAGLLELRHGALDRTRFAAALFDLRLGRARCLGR